MIEPHKARILIALGMDRRAIVMATDSDWVQSEVDAIGAYCEDIGILDAECYKWDCGVYLWEGILSVSVSGPDYDDPETEYNGTLFRSIEDSELSSLLSMKSPVESDLRLDSPDAE